MVHLQLQKKNLLGCVVLSLPYLGMLMHKMIVIHYHKYHYPLPLDYTFCFPFIKISVVFTKQIRTCVN
eukprot:UN04077